VDPVALLSSVGFLELLEVYLQKEFALVSHLIRVGLKEGVDLSQ
jgi:hypothetical protein